VEGALRKSLPIQADGSILIPREIVEGTFGKAREAVVHVRTGCLVLSPIYVDLESGRLPQILEAYHVFQSLDRIKERAFSRSGEDAVQFEGDLAVLSLSDVLLFLSASRKSGLLEVQEESRWGFFFKAGSLVCAAGMDARLGLAAHLLRRQFVTEQDLVEGLSRIEDPQADVPKQLLAISGLTPQEFQDEWVKSVEEMLYRVFALGKGHFRFQNGEVKPPFILPLPMTTTNYVMEATRRMDEWGHLQDRLPPMGAVLVLAEDVTASTALSFEEEQVLGQVTGERTVQEVILKSKVGELEAKKAVVSLLAAGLVYVPQKVEKAVAASPEAIEEAERAPLASRVEAYNAVFNTIYQALQMEAGAKARMILSAFFKGLEPGASVLYGLDLDQDGAIPVNGVLANLAALPRPQRETALVKDLNELLYFQLFAVKNTLGPEMESGIVEMAKTLLKQ
jgi:hypothetical protein